MNISTQVTKLLTHVPDLAYLGRDGTVEAINVYVGSTGCGAGQAVAEMIALSSSDEEERDCFDTAFLSSRPGCPHCGGVLADAGAYDTCLNVDCSYLDSKEGKFPSMGEWF